MCWFRSLVGSFTAAADADWQNMDAENDRTVNAVVFVVRYPRVSCIVRAKTTDNTTEFVKRRYLAHIGTKLKRRVQA